MSVESLNADLDDLRLEVTRHPIFFRPWNLADIRLIMEHHVLAVWDFMTLAKTLQRGLTCLDAPWLPPENPIAARIINEIILAEESDEIQELGFTGSHFELYLAAMQEMGANTTPIERFLSGLATGSPFALALELSGLPAAAHRFTRHTMGIAQRGLHEVAASFVFGREDIIPEMFARALPLIPTGGSAHLRAYLERHIHIDGDRHGPLARKLLTSLCGHDPRRWREAFDAAASSLAARRRLWDDLLANLTCGETAGDDNVRSQGFAVSAGAEI